MNQHLAGSHVVAAAETLAFAKALGLSSREAYKILTRSEGASWIMRDRGVSMLNGDFTPKSAVTIFTKDMVSPFPPFWLLAPPWPGGKTHYR